MIDTGLTFLLAQAATAQPSSRPGLIDTPLVPMILMFVIFYFLLIRPQQKKAKELAEQLKTLKRGDKVVTNGGIVGVIVSVKDKYVTVRSEDSKFEMLRTAVAEITERGNATGAEVKEA
jgi:preprotein translocase subunit YajC